MADTKISGLPASTTPLAGTEVLPIVQSGATKQVSVANLTAGRDVDAKSVTVSGEGAYGQGKLFATGAEGLLLQAKTGSVFDAGMLNAAGNAYAFTVAPGTINMKLWGDTILGNNSGQSHTVNGNLIQGTAAKGVNFTANTPAAGMTSQLLNWYEEGTWTPVVTAGTGTITTVGAVSGRYTRIGRLVTLEFRISITTNGSGGSYLLIAGMPFPSNTSLYFVGCGTRLSTSSLGLCISANTSTQMIMTYSDGTYPGANGVLLQGLVTYSI